MKDKSRLYCLAMFSLLVFWDMAEFTDDFSGWAFYKVNEPLVDVVIAASCLCSAKECK